MGGSCLSGVEGASQNLSMIVGRLCCEARAHDLSFAAPLMSDTDGVRLVRWSSAHFTEVCVSLAPKKRLIGCSFMCRRPPAARAGRLAPRLRCRAHTGWRQVQSPEATAHHRLNFDAILIACNLYAGIVQHEFGI